MTPAQLAEHDREVAESLGLAHLPQQRSEDVAQGKAPNKRAG